jgi:hypothetical protein
MTSVAALMRVDCPRCGPATLHDGTRCVVCGKSAPVPRKRRITSVGAELTAAAAWHQQRVATPAKRVGNGRATFGKR